jgi:predicted HTH transcriptional regulator
MPHNEDHDGGIHPLSMSSDELRALLRQPESTTLEFKDGLPSAEEVQRLIAAFANTEGGTLVIGQHPQPGRGAGLAHPGVVLWHIEEWAKEVTPQPEVEAAQVDLEPYEHFVVVRVARGDQGPYLAEGQVLERRDDRVTPMTASSLAADFRLRRTCVV